MLAASFHIISWVRSKTIGALGQALAQPSHTRSNNAQPRSQQQSEKRSIVAYLCHMPATLTVWPHLKRGFIPMPEIDGKLASGSHP